MIKVVVDAHARCSVLELENLSEEERYRGKKVYGLVGLEMGAWREAYARQGCQPAENLGRGKI